MAGRGIEQSNNNGSNWSTGIFSFRRKSKNKRLKSELAKTQHQLTSITEYTSRENGRLSEKIEESSKKVANLESQLEILSAEARKENRKLEQLFSYSLTAHNDAVGIESKISISENGNEQDTFPIQRLSTIIERIVNLNKKNVKTIQQMKDEIRREKGNTTEISTRNNTLQKEVDKLTSKNKNQDEKLSWLEAICRGLRIEKDNHIEDIRKLNLDLENTKKEMNECTINQIEREAELQTENEILRRELSNAHSANHLAMFQAERLKRERSRMFRAMNIQRQEYKSKLNDAWFMFCKLKKEKDALSAKVSITNTKYPTEFKNQPNLDPQDVATKTKVLEMEQMLFRRDKLISELEDRVKVHVEDFSIFSDMYLSSFLDESFAYSWASSTVVSSDAMSVSPFISESSMAPSDTANTHPPLAGNGESRVSSCNSMSVVGSITIGSDSNTSSSVGSQANSSMALSQEFP